jgi:uncharacterized protein YbbK (DUF523 family)
VRVDQVSSTAKIRLGISACLLGEAVRYDGEHKRDQQLLAAFGDLVQWLPVCPEVECGLPVPRPPMRLEGDPDQPRLVSIQSREDLTERLSNWAFERVRALEAENLAGFVFKSRSPSCGFGSVGVFDADGLPLGEGSGLFVRICEKHWPRMPIEESDRLHDPQHLQEFLDRILTQI